MLIFIRNRPYPHVWLGVTCGKQRSLGRIDILKSIPAKVRFISAEPLLEEIDFSPFLDGSIDWIISGCEQAKKGDRRLMEMDWVRSIDEQLRHAGIAHFFKQRYINDSGPTRGRWFARRPNTTIVSTSSVAESDGCNLTTIGRHELIGKSSLDVYIDCATSTCMNV